MLAEWNYDISYGEMLAVKATLEEWRHWLEGVKHPFVVLNNHRNFEYIWQAKKLNSHQAHWALFFTQFNFHIMYQSGSKSTKADVLSCYYSAPVPIETPEPILPASLVVAPVTWSLDSEIAREMHNCTAPRGCPPGRTYRIYWKLCTNK